MADEPQDPFAAELAKRDAQDPFAAELRKRERENMSGADVAQDVALQSMTGINKGIAEFMSLPYRGVDWIGEKLTGTDFLPNIEEMSAWKPYLQPPAAQTKTGEYVRSAGEIIGGSALPVAATLNRARQMGTAALQVQPTQGVWQGIKDTFTRPYATNPGAAVAADVIASTGAGFAQKGAEDAGFGPTGQAIAGMIGGVTPAAIQGLSSIPGQYVREARAGATPHSKVAQHLTEDISLDDLALQAGVGYANSARTPAQQAMVRQIIDTLGEEMIAANRNAPAAIQATIARVVQDTGLSAGTVRAALRRITTAQAENELMLGEYPSVMSGNTATRMRTPTTILDDLDQARSLQNREAAANLRRGADAGRIEDTNTHWMLDTMANSGGGPGSTMVRRAIDERLDNLVDMARQRVQAWSPNGQTVQDADAALENLRRLARADYRNVYNNPAGTPVNYPMLHGMLPRIVERHLRRMGGYNANQADELRQAINDLYVTRPAGVASREALPDLEDDLAALRMQIREARRQGQPKTTLDDMGRRADQMAEQLRLTRRDASPPTQQILLPTLEQLQNSREAIRGRLDKFRANPGENKLLPIVEPLYRDISRLMRRASPEWARANDRWADLHLDRVARELGQNLSLKANPRFREQMREFNRLAPEAQDFVRIEFAQQFLDAIDNAGRGKNLADLFKTPHIRDLVRTILGDEAAVDMMRMSRDLNIATKSKNMMHGSPTAPRLARQERLNADLNFIQEAEIPTTIGAFVDKLKKYTIGRMIDRRNHGIAQVLTTPMRDVPRVAEQIARMRQAQDVAARYAGPHSVGDALRRAIPDTIRTLPGQGVAAASDDKP